MGVGSSHCKRGDLLCSPKKYNPPPISHLMTSHHCIHIYKNHYNEARVMNGLPLACFSSPIHSTLLCKSPTQIFFKGLSPDTINVLLCHLSLTQPTALSASITYLRKPSLNLSVRVKFSITSFDNISLLLMELVRCDFTYLFGSLFCQNLSSLLVCELHRGCNFICFALFLAL